ncbi:hypothetical protein GLOIN_2v1772887 [Rhizophagus clarus]|uniref:Uncharacterized protein n=1 Tax=Rhizophagus clarus TaxID=94130 RepID=A0A8H3L7D3_9GLOM|nr:hypothetical protein GLOIN_2v1772887 [Rhizophagus clarus]
MKKKDGADYSVNFIRASLAAINHFLQEKSRIKNIDIYNDSYFKAIKKLLDGTTPDRLLRRVFFINAIYLGLHGGEHALFNGTDFVKCDDGGYNEVKEEFGIPKEEIKLLSHHYSAGLLSYILPSNDKKDEIIRRFIDKIHGKLTLDNVKVPEILNGQDLYNEKVIGNENNNFKITKKSILRKSTKFFKKAIAIN